jgi:hypothetical protein
MQQFRVAPRVFFKKLGKRKKSLSLPDHMDDCLEKLAERYGYTTPELISVVLDQFLIQEAIDGRIPWPEGFDPKTLEE